MRNAYHIPTLSHDLLSIIILLSSYANYYHWPYRFNRSNFLQTITMVILYNFWIQSWYRQPSSVDNTKSCLRQYETTCSFFQMFPNFCCSVSKVFKANWQISNVASFSCQPRSISLRQLKSASLIETKRLGKEPQVFGQCKRYKASSLWYKMYSHRL